MEHWHNIGETDVTNSNHWQCSPQRLLGSLAVNSCWVLRHAKVTCASTVFVFKVLHFLYSLAVGSARALREMDSKHSGSELDQEWDNRAKEH